uniref:ENTH domain-containing protein n=1 Tax=Vannella robusta TaxID=1487602 RepID=A0A6U1UHQ3_9EUKA|eukprot:CAMPEP_0206194172 /NCGR_PEP_ID=MMETSP0166-20121206/7032_1 /ASSEMBLY_ACC=CAM_ASM_000260 /TAXON_ID=95228 /ORGANISM="Vannella robusta, Strain DIVA3 518/3/11/1/6" /LENGTH=131 /DNA_ID=CAMNT_0053611081 /DNA_START=29 /DNA_END=424 /DNA_ORIENTATION=-
MGIKTFTKNVTSAQTTVDPPEGALKKLAVGTKNFVQFQDVMTTIWKRIGSSGKDYIHVQKGLLVLEYLLLHGSEQVLTESRVHQPEISTLTDFRSTHAADNGALIRERAYAVMKWLNDEEALKAKRAELAS